MKAVDLMCQMVTKWGSILTDDIARQMEAYLGTKLIYNKTDEVFEIIFGSSKEGCNSNKKFKTSNKGFVTIDGKKYWIVSLHESPEDNAFHAELALKPNGRTIVSRF